MKIPDYSKKQKQPTYLDMQEEIERLNNIIKEVREYIEQHIKYECDNAFNGMQFYSYHLYDFNKKELLEILDKVDKENNNE